MKSVRACAGWGAVLALGTALFAAPSASAQGAYTVGWGLNADYQVSPVPTNAVSNVTAIAAGYFHSLALVDGRVWAWGKNTSGQTNVPVAAQSGVAEIAAGSAYSMARKNDGTVVVWGTGAITNVPASASGLSAIAAGEAHALALKSGGIVAWGDNTYNQTNVPVELTSGVTAIAAGGYFSMALKDGGVQVFGIAATNADAGSIRSVPAEATNGVTAIAAGKWHALALKAGGVIAWGTPYYDATNVPVEAQGDVSAIAAGDCFSIALKTDGTLVIWGDDFNGQTNVPSHATSGITKIAAGSGHCLAVGPAIPARFVGSQLPDAYQGYPYTNGFVQAIGDPTVRYYAYGSWPSWMTLNATNGAIGGTPTNLGTSAFSVRASNVYGQVTNSFQVAVLERPLGPPIFLTTNPLPSGVVGAPYAQQVVVTNGGTFSLVAGEGDLPAGLTLDSTGWITGTPTAVESLQFTVRATNLVGSSNRIYNLAIEAPAGAPVFITASPLPNGVVGLPYVLQIGVSNYPTSMGLAAGALPVGLGVSGTGLITGMPVQVETADFTLFASNMVGVSNQVYTLQVYGPPEFVTTSPLPDGSLGVPYSQQIQATGDATYGVSAGALPDGLTLADDGWLTGTPTNAGAFNFTVEAVNAYGATYRDFDLQIGAQPVFSTTNPLPVGQVGTAYSQQIVASGSPTFSVFDGSLPGGLDLSDAGLLNGTPTVAGAFNFTVRATNEYGWSNRVYDLTILGQYPPQFTLIRRTNNNVRLEWVNSNGVGNVQVWFSTNIVRNPVVWSNLGVQTSPWTNAAPATTSSYYRLILVP